MKLVKKMLVFLVYSFLLLELSADEIQKMGNIEYQAYKKNWMVPVLTLEYPGLDLFTAYDVQKVFVEKILHHDDNRGFKAGLTSETAQNRFGLNAPVAGVLFESGLVENNSVINSIDFHVLMIETEIGLIFADDISSPLSDINDLKRHINTVLPVIELPDLGFEDSVQLKGVDIIAANVSSRKYITGDHYSPWSLDLNAINVSLFRDETEVNKGQGSDALGDQWQAALWLVNFMINQGWKIKAGDLIITGALGNMVPGLPGNYQSVYSGMGTIEFTIE